MTDLLLFAAGGTATLFLPLVLFVARGRLVDRRRRKAAERRSVAEFARRLHAINEDTHTVADPHSWTDLVSEPDTREVHDPHLGVLNLPLEEPEPLVFYRLANEVALHALRRIGQPTAVGAGWVEFSTREYRAVGRHAADRVEAVAR